MASFWAEEFSEWMRLGERMLGDGVESLVGGVESLSELTGRAMQPWAEVLDAATRRLVGRAVEYEADGVMGRATIDAFRVVGGDPARLATDVEATLAEPHWGEHSAVSLTVRASRVQPVLDPVPEVRADRVELSARFDASTVGGWFGAGAMRLIGFDAEGLTVRWRWRRLKLTVHGTPAAAGDRLHLVARRVSVFGRGFDLPAAPRSRCRCRSRCPAT